LLIDLYATSSSEALKMLKQPHAVEAAERLENRNMKIAFCFLSTGDVSQPAIWNRFFSSAPRESYKVYSHPKEPGLVTSEFLQGRIINNRVPTRHGDVSLVKATLTLFSTAYYDDPEIEYFVLLSESTIPILPFNNIYNIIKQKGARSIINYNVPPPNSEHHSRLSSVTTPALFAAAFFHHDQWIILHRRHVNKLLDHPSLTLFRNVFAPDEHYFMNVLVHQKGAALDEFVKHAATFVNWHEKTVKTYMNPNTGEFIARTVHPKTYHQLSGLEIVQALGEHCWFFRKVDRNCNCEFLSACV
jgi:Core-2/I-Branching enzyme